MHLDCWNLTPLPYHPPFYELAKMAEGMFYNVTGGYVEGIVRGYRNTLLTGQNYGNLTQVSRKAV